MIKKRIDANTIRKAVNGDEESIAEILEYYRPFIISIYNQTEIHPNSYDLDELISMCYLKIYQRIPKFKFLKK